MNGFLLNVLISVIGGLIALANVLFGLLLRAHKEADEERARRMDLEIERLRDRLHEWAPHIGWVEQQRRFGNDP